LGTFFETLHTPISWAVVNVQLLRKISCQILPCRQCTWKIWN